MSKKILLVEDDHFIIECMTRRLKYCGDCEVVSATSNQAAREEFSRAQDWQLIILDGHLTDGDSKELAEELRKTFPGPILCNTADFELECWFQEKGFEVFSKIDDIKVFWIRVEQILMSD